MPGLIDTHCHLLSAVFEKDFDGVLDRAWRAGVEAIVVPATGEEESGRVVSLTSTDARLHAAVGVHPDVADGNTVDIDALDRLIRGGGVVAVGEVGLDGHMEHADMPSQEAALRGQVALARDHGLPLLVHCRDSFGRMFALLRAFGPHGPGGVFHAFAGSLETAMALAALGFSFGVGGTATRPGSTRIRSVIAALPLERLVLETDAPYIGTERSPRGKVEPADVAEVAEVLAGLKGIALEKVAEETTANARKLLRI